MEQYKIDTMFLFQLPNIRMHYLGHRIDIYACQSVENSVL